MNRDDICHIDIESTSEAPLKKTGLYKYAADPTTAIHCTCYAFGDAPVHLWVLFELWELPQLIVDALQKHLPGRWLAQRTCPAAITEHAAAGKQFRAHNAQFERTLLNGAPGQRIGFPKTPISQWACTAVKAATFGLQRALGDAAKSMGTYPKSEDGKAGMMQLAKPCVVTKKHPEGRYTIYTDPEKFVNLYLYCVDDVNAERDLDKHIPDISASEQADWELDQAVNDRGVAVDRQSVLNCQALIEEHKANIEKEFTALTGLKPSQTGAVAEWVRNKGYDILDLQAGTVADAVKDDKCPKEIKHVLVLRSIHASKATAKYPAILKALMDDDRIRGMFLYYGSGTGRWSSMIVQLQNLFRGAIDDPDTAIGLYKSRNLELIKAMYGIEPMKVFSSTVRGMLIAPEGKDLIAVDYAGIESRVIAWIYDELWKLEAFRKQDTEGGPDNYMIAYANTFRIPVHTVNKKQRQIGKPIDLGLGFEGGVGAFKTMAKTYNVDLAELTKMAWDKIPEEYMEQSRYDIEMGWIRADGDLPLETVIVCNAIKHAWRAAHPKIKQGWRDTKDAAIAAVANPGIVTQIPSGKIKFRVEGRWLRMRLPSGRKLNYFMPRVEGEGRDKRVTFMGIDTDTRRWMRCDTYGGFWAQNATQAIANDLLRHGMKNVRAFEGDFYSDDNIEVFYTYDLVGSVHDEAIMEVPEGCGSVKEVEQLLCDTPAWAKGLPVVAEGWRAKRYKK